MQNLEGFQFPYGADNYGVLVHDPDSAQTACVDAGDAAAAMAALQQQGWKLTHLLITHHHADHTAGLMEIKNATGCQVIGPEPVSKPIAGMDSTVTQGSEFDFAGRSVQVLHTPGHTMDMVNYHFIQDKLVFTGDTLFSMGCGRLFEGDAAMMLESMNKLKALPADTMVYCAHEYSATNARFALDVDPDNEALQQRAAQVTQLREAGKATVPVSLQQELDTNPFLRTDNRQLRESLAMIDVDEVAVFAALRERRNQY